MPPPRSVREVTNQLGQQQRALAEEAVALVGSAARRARTAEGWRDGVARIGAQLLRIQVAVAELADPYLTDVLEAQGASPAADAVVNPAAWRDYTDGGGSWLLNLVYAVNSVPRAGVASELLEQQVNDLASSIVLTGLQDTGRSSVQAAMHARAAATGYVRMLNPPSCARCAILAGRVYRRSTPFRRHPRCDCRNVPAAEDVSDDWTTDPASYFRSLDRAEQDRIFTVAGAEAIRLGGVKQAAINQVVNARSGVSTVTAYGRQMRITTTGTTKRATFGGHEVLDDGTVVRRTGAAPVRLLPDEIFQLSEEFGWDRAETLRELRRYAYVL